MTEEQGVTVEEGLDPVIELSDEALEAAGETLSAAHFTGLMPTC